MDEVRRKIYLDLFASPWTLLPLVGGLTALLGSWAVGGNTELTFAGIAGVMAGAGIFASRIIFGLEQLTERAYSYVIERQQRQQLKALNSLKRKLQRDEDPRTEKLLTLLWQMYKTLEQDIKEGKIGTAAHEVLEGVDRLFTVCVDHLERSYDLWRKSKRMRGDGRDSALRRRETLISEVEESAGFLAKKIDQLEIIADDAHQSELARLRAELDESIRVAREVENRKTELTENESYDPSEFE
ncbi:MAG: hypothetical protein AAGF97_04895 [Planctomycetota bacterium]